MREAIEERKSYLRRQVGHLTQLVADCPSPKPCRGCGECEDYISIVETELALLDFEPRSGALKL